MTKLCLFFTLLPVLLACDEITTCKEAVYDKSRYSSVTCEHSHHKLVDLDAQWMCKCIDPSPPQASASASASASGAATEPPPAPASAPKPEEKTDDYSWLDP
jgi:hypothetical protein